MYIYWLIGFVCTPILIIWLLQFNLLWKYRKTILLVIFLALLISIPWDVYAVKTAIWSFPRAGNMGIYIGILPLEEYLFMILVTLLIATITIITKYKLQTK